MRLAWLALALALPAMGWCEQEVYLEPALRGIEIYRPRGQFPQMPAISAYEVELVRQEVACVPKGIHDGFRPAWDGWKATWSGGPPSIDTPEYDLLAEMGRPILPLIVDRLLLEDNAPGIVLYDHVAPFEWYSQAPADESAPPPVALRMRVLRTIRRWLELAPKASYIRHD